MDIRRDALSGAVDVEQARESGQSRWSKPGGCGLNRASPRVAGPRERWTVNPLLWPAGTAETLQKGIRLRAATTFLQFLQFLQAPKTEKAEIDMIRRWDGVWRIVFFVRQARGTGRKGS